MKKAILISAVTVSLIFVLACSGENHKVKSEKHDEHDHSQHESTDYDDENVDLHDEHGEEAHGDGSCDSHEKESHKEHEHEGGKKVAINKEQQTRINLKILEAGPGTIDMEGTFPGEITLDPDRVAHIVPVLSGIVRKAEKKLGDVVSKGEVIATLESRELAELKALFLAAQSKEQQALTVFNREKELWEVKKITSEQEYLTAKQKWEEATIELVMAKRQLIAIGFSRSYLDRLHEMKDEFLTSYEIVSPIKGVIVEKHAVLGETVGPEENVFTVADLSNLWVTFNIYRKDMNIVKVGQAVRIDLGADGYCDGFVRYVSPIVDEQTRTTEARVELDNSQGRLRPGTYVTVQLTEPSRVYPVVIKKRAIQILEEKEVVFVPEGDSFEAIPVELGLSDQLNVVVLSGLSSGQPYVSNGAFELKAEIVSSGLGAHAGHGH